MSAHSRRPPSHLPFPLDELANALQHLDIIWFRGIAVAVSAGGIIYKLISPRETPPWLVVCWNIAFILINFIQIGMLLRERRGVRFTEEERELYVTVFRQFAPVEFMKLLRLSKWLTAQPGEKLAAQGELLADLMLIYNGAAEVYANGEAVAQLRDGAFIGEMSLIREGPATATVTVTEPTRYLCWPKAELKQLLERNPAMAGTMHSVVASDLTRKLLTPRDSVAVTESAPTPEIVIAVVRD